MVLKRKLPSRLLPNGGNDVGGGVADKPNGDAGAVAKQLEQLNQAAKVHDDLESGFSSKPARTFEDDIAEAPAPVVSRPATPAPAPLPPVVPTFAPPPAPLDMSVTEKLEWTIEPQVPVAPVPPVVPAVPPAAAAKAAAEAEAEEEFDEGDDEGGDGEVSAAGQPVRGDNPNENPLRRKVKRRRKRGSGLGQQGGQAGGHGGQMPQGQPAVAMAAPVAEKVVPVPPKAEFSPAPVVSKPAMPVVEKAAEPARRNEFVAPKPVPAPEPKPVETFVAPTPVSAPAAPAVMPAALLAPSLMAESAAEVPAPVVQKPSGGADAWDFGAFPPPPPAFAAQPATMAPAAMPAMPAAAPADIYGDMAKADNAFGRPKTESLPPPELPGTPRAGYARSSRSSPAGPLKFFVLGAALLLAVVVFILMRSGDNGGTLDKFSETYASVKEEIPATPEQPAEQATMGDVQQLEADLEQQATMLEQAGQPATDGSVGAKMATKIDFVTVGEDEASKPIAADGTETMPEEIGAIARLQKEIARLKAEKEGVPVSATADPVAAAATSLDGAALTDASETRRQIEEELAAYRKALMDSSSIGGKEGEGKAALTAEVTAAAGATGLPPSSMYANNPKNLPMMAEPEAIEEPKIRTLNDFDLAMFEPEK
ncbi:MAG: hypothetical protein WAX89_01860, partial [Alphaproteobacteria bacterium]